MKNPHTQTTIAGTGRADRVGKEAQTLAHPLVKPLQGIAIYAALSSIYLVAAKPEFLSGYLLALCIGTWHLAPTLRQHWMAFPILFLVMGSLALARTFYIDFAPAPEGYFTLSQFAFVFAIAAHYLFGYVSGRTRQAASI